jgi:hypothetical protein
VRFIDEHKGRFGVQPICRVLREHGVQIAPSTYYAAIGRAPSKRAVRDGQLKDEILRVWKANYEVYGAFKIWRELGRQGVTVARWQHLLHPGGRGGYAEWAIPNGAPPNKRTKR